MSKRGRMAAIGTAVFALACGFALVCCTQPTKPAVDATPARSGTREAGEGERATQPSDPAIERREARSGDQAADSTQPHIDMETPEQPEPRTPRYLAIVEQVHVDREASVRSTIRSPTKLELETDNVKRLRITREGLPLVQNSSIVLRIDGQGIEWTPQYTAVELERSSAGTWTVVDRRPSRQP